MKQKLSAWIRKIDHPDPRTLIRDILLTIGVLFITFIICLLLRKMDQGDTYVCMLFMLAVVIIARYTDGYRHGVLACLISVGGINYVFTAPYFEFNLEMPGYPLAFASMLVVSLIISAMTTRLKKQEQQRYKAQVEEMRSNLLRAVSHDLRTPLTSISGAASVLMQQTDLARPQQEQLLSEIIDDSQWLVRMVENLLSITRINAEPAQLKKTSEAAEEVVVEAVRKFRKRFARPQVEINLPEDLIFVPMDAILIEQVITNLLENVVFHAQSATICRVDLHVEGRYACFCISDNGPGIAPKRLPTLFESSITHPNHTSADDTRSMGIGLSVCRAIILAHGGRIEAANRPTGGAAFTFYLPLEG